MSTVSFTPSLKMLISSSIAYFLLLFSISVFAVNDLPVQKSKKVIVMGNLPLTVLNVVVFFQVIR